MLDEHSPALVLPLFVVFPLTLHVGVGFQLRIGFGFGHAQLAKHPVDSVHQDGVDAFTLILRFDGY